MKQLTDTDIENMCGTFVPDDKQTARTVRTSLDLRKLCRGESHSSQKKHIRLDLHGMTEEQAWDAINSVLNSDARTAEIITGASGILKLKFQQWATDSIISHRIISITPINRGSFQIQIKKKR